MGGQIAIDIASQVRDVCSQIVGVWTHQYEIFGFELMVKIPTKLVLKFSIALLACKAERFSAGISTRRHALFVPLTSSGVCLRLKNLSQLENAALTKGRPAWGEWIDHQHLS